MNILVEWPVIQAIILLADIWTLAHEEKGWEWVKRVEEEIVMTISYLSHEGMDNLPLKDFETAIDLLETKMRHLQYNDEKEEDMIRQELEKTGSDTYDGLDCVRCGDCHVKVYSFGASDDNAFCRECYLGHIKSALRDKQNRIRREKLK